MSDPRNNPPSPLSAHFMINYDDSTDDEERKEEKSKDEKDKDLLQRYCAWRYPAQLKTTNNLDDNELLSFISHFAGVKLFYSDKVNQLYYKNKRERLADKDGTTIKNQLLELIKSAILMQAESSIESVKRLLPLYNLVTGFDSLKIAVLDNFEKALLNIIPNHVGGFVDFFKKEKQSTFLSNLGNFLEEYKVSLKKIFFEAAVKPLTASNQYSRGDLKTRLENELLNNFSGGLQPILKAKLDKFYRVTLGITNDLENINFYSFLANLRLTNRSQKRQRKNLKCIPIYGYNAVSRIWKFNTAQHGVLEIQKILQGSHGRKDEVLGLGNYDNVYKAIKTIKISFNVTDPEIAHWVRNILRCQNTDFKIIPIEHRSEVADKLETLTYLLFGCEAVRNPAMLVINQMLLDLIIDNPQHWSWEEALTGKLNATECLSPRRMPMSLKGAISAARGLETRYNKFLPCPYEYPGTEKKNGKLNPETLIELEARVVRHWIKSNETSCEYLNRYSKINFAEFLVKNIEISYAKWFGAINEVTQPSTSPPTSTPNTHVSESSMLLGGNRVAPPLLTPATPPLMPPILTNSFYGAVRPEPTRSSSSPFLSSSITPLQLSTSTSLPTFTPNTRVSEPSMLAGNRAVPSLLTPAPPPALSMLPTNNSYGAARSEPTSSSSNSFSSNLRMSPPSTIWCPPRAAFTPSSVPRWGDGRNNFGCLSSPQIPVITFGPPVIPVITFAGDDRNITQVSPAQNNGASNSGSLPSMASSPSTMFGRRNPNIAPLVPAPAATPPPLKPVVTKQPEARR